jgi:hypothetical protein
MPRETPTHSGESVNVGRMSAGEHHHNIVATSDKLPRRGSTGPGTAQPARMEPSGARYSLKPLGKRPPIKK